VNRAQSGASPAHARIHRSRDDMPQMLLKACPHCRRAVGQTARCPYCGGSLAAGAEPPRSAAAGDSGATDGVQAARLRARSMFAAAVFWLGLALQWTAAPSVAPGGDPLSAAAMLVPLLAGLMMLAGAIGYAVMTRRIARLKRALPAAGN